MLEIHKPINATHKSCNFWSFDGTVDVDPMVGLIDLLNLNGFLVKPW